MIIDELNKKIADIESLANDKTSTIESKVSELQDGLLMVADAVDTIPGVIDEKITAITKEFATIKDTVKKVKAQKGDKGDRGEPGIDGIGIKGDKGEDGSPDTGEQIADKLNELEGVLDTKVLKDFTIPDVSNLQTQINTIGNQTLRLLSRPTSSSFTGVTTDSTLSGLGTTASPLSVISVAPSDVAITVRAATTANLAGSPVYANGTSGVGATLTRGTNGTLPTQDGVTLAVNDRILVKNQTTTLQNGIYVVTSLGSASTKWVLTRATDADSTTELDELVVTVSEGSTNRGTVWGQQTNNPTVGTSAITFATATSTAVTQATSGTQAIYQIPTLTGTARQITRGTANFKYNPTNDLFTIRGVGMTFPAANASGVLTNNGSGTLSWADVGGVEQVKVTLTPKQFTSAILNNTPITLVAAPGSGKYINVLSADMKLTYGTADYTQTGFVGVGTDTSATNFKFVLQNEIVNNPSSILSALNTNSETQSNDLTNSGTIISISENSPLQLFPYSTCSIKLTGRNFQYSTPTSAFINGETVTGDISGNTGIVWFDNGTILGVDSPSGAFSGDTTITGGTSGCVATIDRNNFGGDSTLDFYITYKIVTL